MYDEGDDYRGPEGCLEGIIFFLLYLGLVMLVPFALYAAYWVFWFFVAAMG